MRVAFAIMWSNPAVYPASLLVPFPGLFMQSAHPANGFEKRDIINSYRKPSSVDLCMPIVEIAPFDPSALTRSYVKRKGEYVTAFGTKD
jgi:hypothetical protein